MEEARKAFLQATPMPVILRTEQRMLVVGVSVTGPPGGAAWPEGVVWEAQVRAPDNTHGNLQFQLRQCFNSVNIGPGV